MLLSAVGVSKSYAGVHALKSISFELERGEVHALIGENGAGKSTFIKILTGAVQPDAGVIHLDGAPIACSSPRVARSLGISAIYQQPALFPHLTVAENIGLATEQPALLRRIDWNARRARCRELLARAGSSIHPDAQASSLSMPEQQVVEIAKALGTNAKVLILDEPTSSLTHREVESLFRVIRDLRSQGVGIVYISHRLEELPEIADRVTVLRDGEAIGTRGMAGITQPELIAMMVGRELSAVFPKRAVPVGEVALEVRGRVNFTVRAGEILGIAGLAGAGRTELAESIFGLRPAADLEILIHRQPIAYVPEDRRRHGLIMEMSIAANATLASLPSLSRRGFLDFGAERALAQDYKMRLAVKAASIDVPVETLSGGNQQKVVIARWLATHPSVLILDEPTQGVDVGAKSEIHRIMVDLARQGVAIVMISSELPEILGMSDRVAVMRGGRIAGMLNRADADQSKILALALGSAA